MSDVRFADHNSFAEAFETEVQYNGTMFNRSVVIAHGGGTMRDVRCATAGCKYWMRCDTYICTIASEGIL